MNTDQERVTVTYTRLPQVTVGMPLSLLRWVEVRARAADQSRAAWIRGLIERERDGVEAPNDEPEGAAA